jgi:mRNA interferase RelE/StbE
MVYRVELKQSAVDSLSKIPTNDRKRIGKKIDTLAVNPRPRGVLKLTGDENMYRIRSGDYRIIYQIEDDKLLVLVVRVGQRGDVYRNLP